MGRVLGFLAVAGLGVVMYNRWKAMNDSKTTSKIKREKKTNVE